MEDDKSDWTPEMIEEDRLSRLHDPLFDMWLKFERAFCRIAVDRLDISDADAELIAQDMERTETPSGKAYAYLIRQIPMERIMRRIGHQFAAVVAANGPPEFGMSIPEISKEYAKLPKGDA